LPTTSAEGSPQCATLVSNPIICRQLAHMHLVGSLLKNGQSPGFETFS
jgi:hypothetical protein